MIKNNLDKKDLKVLFQEFLIIAKDEYPKLLKNAISLRDKYIKAGWPMNQEFGELI